MSMRYLVNILNPVNSNETEYLDNSIIQVSENNIIESVLPITEQTDLTGAEDLREYITIPGLIDTHTHLPQHPIIGSYGNTLLEWLNRYTFPAEIKLSDPNYARSLAQTFFKALQNNGTTTAVLFATIHPEATDIIFQEAEASNLRIFTGKNMMNQNSPVELSEDTFISLKDSERLQKKWDKKTDKLNYVYSPRFAVSCDKGMLCEAGKLASRSDTFVQTHLNENMDEIKLVAELFPEASSYTDVYNRAGLLGPKTLLAHCIHNTDDELNLIKKTDSKIIHCPDANFFLKSGRFEIEKIEEVGITFGLGSDVGAGTSLDMFHIMKMMIYMQNLQRISDISMQKAFYYATLGNAEVLGLKNEIGSIAVGKKADFAVIKLNKGLENFKEKSSQETAQNILSELIFGQKEVIKTILS